MAMLVLSAANSKPEIVAVVEVVGVSPGKKNRPLPPESPPPVSRAIAAPGQAQDENIESDRIRISVFMDLSIFIEIPLPVTIRR